MKRERCAKEVCLIETLIQTILLTPKLEYKKVSFVSCGMLSEFCSYEKRNGLELSLYWNLSKTRDKSPMKWLTCKSSNCHIIVRKEICTLCTK